jgi:glycosyltransferase involved in cell wall biosynthesis
LPIATDPTTTDASSPVATGAVRTDARASNGGAGCTSGESRWHGRLDRVEHERIAGWAHDLDAPGHALVLRVFDNGIPLADVTAERFREDLKEAGIGSGHHAFVLQLPRALPRALRHVIEVRRADDGRLLWGSPQILEAEIDLAALAVGDRPRASWRGHIDVVTRGRIEGWAFDPSNPDAPLGLVIFNNGEVIARVLANRFRPDLESAGVGTGRHAFSYTIPGGLAPTRRHVIQVIGEADGCEMPTSPVVIEPGGGLDADLESALANAIGGLASGEEREGAVNFLGAQLERLLQQSADSDGRREARMIRRQLARRWGKVAFGDEAAQPGALSAAATRRALVVDDLVPALDRDAGSNAIVSHMRALLALGYEVSFVAAATLGNDAQAGAALAGLGVHHCRAPFYASVEEILRRQSECFDLIYLHRLSNASRYIALARDYGGRAQVLYSVADLHFLRLSRQAQAQDRPELEALSARVRQSELVAAASAGVVITHSSFEADLLRKAVKNCNVHVVPWALTPRPTAVPWSERAGIAFIGHFSHAPNPDAARYLVQQIMPRVWRTHPHIQCFLAGSAAGSALEQLKGPRVEVLGHVAALASLFDRVRLTVAPLRFGAGIKGKVLESFAAGVPCVMSHAAAEGIPLPAALLRCVADDPEVLASQIIRMHEDAGAAAAAAAAASELIARHYSEAVVIEKLRAATEGRRAPA